MVTVLKKYWLYFSQNCTKFYNNRRYEPIASWENRIKIILVNHDFLSTIHLLRIEEQFVMKAVMPMTAFQGTIVH